MAHSNRARIITGRDRGAVPEPTTSQLVIGACGHKINPRHLATHLAMCGQCLAWWMSNNPSRDGRERGKQ